ncbi:MAG: hypothetical protein JXB49_06060 [Bacteroidales bacterium]|nr:hypothetical protein [Bacteroidales bacterium]
MRKEVAWMFCLIIAIVFFALLGYFIYLGITENTIILWILGGLILLGFFFGRIAAKTDEKRAFNNACKFLSALDIEKNQEKITSQHGNPEWEGMLFDVPVQLEYNHHAYGDSIIVKIPFKTKKTITFEHLIGYPYNNEDWIKNSHKIFFSILRDFSLQQQLEELLQDTRFTRITARHSTTSCGYAIIPNYDKDGNIDSGKLKQEADILTIMLTRPCQTIPDRTDIDREFLKSMVTLLCDVKKRLENLGVGS